MTAKAIKSPVNAIVYTDAGPLKKALVRVRKAGADHVRVRSGPGGVTVTGGNGSARAQITLAAEYEGRMDAVVGHAALRDAVQDYGARSELVLEQDAEHLRITAGSGVKALSLAGDGVFCPELPQFLPESGQQLVHAVGSQLRDAVATVAHAVSRDEKRPVLCMILLEADQDGARMVGCDSYRLMIAPVPGVAAESMRVCVHGRGLMDATMGLRAGEGVLITAYQQVGPFGVMLEREGERWAIEVHSDAKGITYPKWQQLMPVDPNTKVEVNRAALHEAASACARISKAGVPVRVAVGDDELTLRCDVPDGESFTGTVPASVTGDRFEIGFDATYLAQLTHNAPCSTLTLELHTPLRPVKVIAGDATGLLMPKRLNI